MLSSTSVFYMMHFKPLAAKASVLKLPTQLLQQQLCLWCRVDSRTEPDFTEDGFYRLSDFSQMLGFFYGCIVGLEGVSGLRSYQPGRRRVDKGDEFNKAAPAPQVPPQAPAAPAPASWENGNSPANEPPTPPACEGAKVGACYPAPSEGTVQRPAASKRGSQQRMKKKASMSLYVCLKSGQSTFFVQSCIILPNKSVYQQPC